MKPVFLILSVVFVVHGFLPYKKTTTMDTSRPNQIVIDQQECGCPCPDAMIISGQLQIPDEISNKYKNLSTTEINLQIKSFNDPYNYELGHAKLFVTGDVVGADTILCDPTNCLLAPRFKVGSWSLVDTVATAWFFPKWLFGFFLVNLVLIMPTLIIIEIVKPFRGKRLSNNDI